ncbi:MAG: hypothetical protein MUO35_00145 [Anaerolineales bacterium]|nr:hypothetical protein [Anaerolineales bacterium]
MRNAESYPNNLTTVALITETIHAGQTPMTSISTISGAMARTSRRLISRACHFQASFSGP